MAFLVDHHVHLYPPEVAADPEAWARAKGERQWALLCTRRRRSGVPVQGFPTAEALLRAMDGAGIERSILLGWYWEKVETCSEQNRFLAACVRAHPDRLGFFGSLHAGAAPADLKAEIERLRSEACAGIGELSPHTQAPGADWDAVFSAAADAGWPVTLHVTHPSGRPYPGRVETPLEDFVGWASRHPRTAFILAHWGGGLAGDPRALSRANIRFDAAASPLVASPDEAARCLAAAGAARVLFGSDYPLNLYPQDGYEDFGLARWADAWRGLHAG